MPMLVSGRVGTGIGKSSDSLEVPIRMTQMQGVAVQDLHGRYLEAAIRGRLFVAANAVAGATPGTAFSTTPPIALWNPPGSGVVLSINKVTMGYVSGTLGAGTVAAGVTPGQSSVPTTGTELVPAACLLGAPRGLARAFTGSTLVAAPTMLRPLFVMGAGLASTALLEQMLSELVDGEFVVPENTVFAIQGCAAASGTSPLAIFSITYEEIPSR